MHDPVCTSLAALPLGAAEKSRPASTAWQELSLPGKPCLLGLAVLVPSILMNCVGNNRIKRVHFLRTWYPYMTPFPQTPVFLPWTLSALYIGMEKTGDEGPVVRTDGDLSDNCFS